ncbi:MAG TPA: hypothetical protein PKA95_00060 [Thermomicrobiales bacterium]|nr:hypothetical protein [Thermomicrobiales bacterium]
MSTGDLLFIFAFIVLPTIILVSCIWTLLLIRAGVLLPARRAVVNDTEALVEDDNPQPADAVETTAVHEMPARANEAEPVVIEVVEAPAVDTALPAPEPLPAIEPVVADATPSEAPQEPAPDDEPADEFEHTTEFPIIDDAMLERAAAEAATAEAKPPSPAASDQPAEEPIPAPDARHEEPARASAPDLEVLFVPLPDETLPDGSLATSNGTHEPDILDEVEDEIAEGDPDDSSPPRRDGRFRRKSVRRVAQLRPSEEQSPNVSPMGNLLRRSRSGNSR